MEDGDRDAVPILPSRSLVNTMDVKIFFAHVVLQRSHTHSLLRDQYLIFRMFFFAPLWRSFIYLESMINFRNRNS